MAKQAGELEGLLIETSDGTRYLIDDDALEACRLEGEALENVKRLADENEVSGFALQELGLQMTVIGDSSLVSGPAEKRERGARTARNIRTGAPIKVKATSVPAY